MSKINFVLSDELQQEDSLGVGYVYQATKHPYAEDVMIIHYQDDGEWGTANYTINDYNAMFNEGHWIKVD